MPAGGGPRQRGLLSGGKQGAVTWITELLWREFYRHVLVGYPWVSRHQPFNRDLTALPWREDPEGLAAWQQGRTGIPIIDAAMRQLLQTGWMHNRMRMLTAMFLCKNLLIDWRQGERWFMRQLIDGDLASNNGGWQWSASTGTDSVPYFRVFNPHTQALKIDARGDYVRTWIPELADLKGKAVHTPGGRYLTPLVDLGESRQRALAAYRGMARKKDTKSRTRSGFFHISPGSESMAVEQRIGLDAIVGLLDAGVGVVSRTDADALGVADLQAQADTVFEVEGRTQVLLANLGAGEDGDADTGFDEGLHLALAEFVDEHRGEGQRMLVGRPAVVTFPVGVARIPVASQATGGALPPAPVPIPAGTDTVGHAALAGGTDCPGDFHSLCRCDATQRKRGGYCEGKQFVHESALMDVSSFYELGALTIKT